MGELGLQKFETLDTKCASIKSKAQPERITASWPRVDDSKRRTHESWLMFYAICLFERMLYTKPEISCQVLQVGGFPLLDAIGGVSGGL